MKKLLTLLLLAPAILLAQSGGIQPIGSRTNTVQAQGNLQSIGWLAPGFYSDTPTQVSSIPTGALVVRASDSIIYRFNGRTAVGVQHWVAWGVGGQGVNSISVNGGSALVGNVGLTIPTNNNQLTNGSNFITAAQAPVRTVNGLTGDITIDGSETKLAQGANILISGLGTIGSPYIISSTGGGGGGANADSLRGAPIDTAGKLVNYVLAYDTTGVAAGGRGKWKAKAISTTLAGLTDVQLTSLTNNQVLQYNNSLSKWVNVTPPWITTISGIVVGGDLSGTLPNPTVAKLNGLAASYYLDYTHLTNVPTSLPPSGSAGGDLGSTYPNPIVDGILNKALPSLANGVLVYSTGSGTWVFNNNFVTRTELSDSLGRADTIYANVPLYVIHGTHDTVAVKNDSAAWNAYKFQGIPVSITPPTNGQVYVYNSGSNIWVPGAGGSGGGPVNITTVQGVDYDSVLSSTGTGGRLDTATILHAGLVSSYVFTMTHHPITIRKGYFTKSDSLLYSNADTLFAKGLFMGPGLKDSVFLDSIKIFMDTAYVKTLSGWTINVGNLSPLFTAAVGSNNVVTFSPVNVSSYAAYGNFTGSTAAPSFSKIPIQTLANGTANTAVGFDNSSAPTGLVGAQGIGIAAGQIILTAQLVGRDSVVTITSGTSSTVTNGFNVVRFNPSSVMSTYTLTLPTTWHTTNDLLISFSPTTGFAQGDPVVTTLTILAGSGQSFWQRVTPITAEAGEVIRYHLIGTIDQRTN